MVTALIDQVIIYNVEDISKQYFPWQIKLQLPPPLLLFAIQKSNENKRLRWYGGRNST